MSELHDIVSRASQPNTTAADRIAMHELFEAYLESPSAERFRRLRRGVMRQSWYPPEPTELFPLAAALRNCQWQMAREHAERLLPDWPLSLRVHAAAAVAAEQLHDQDDAELEQFVTSTLLRGVLACGNGKLQRPYPITFWGDSAVVLEALGIKPCRQELLEHRGRRLDCFHTEAGEQLYFDVSPLLAAAPANGWRAMESVGWPS